MEKKKKRILISLIISGILLVGAGISYAYWMFTLSQTNPNRATTACLQIELINESSGINLGMASPITDEEGMALEPYEFTIKSTCDSFISYEVLVGVINTSTLDSQYVAAVLDKNQIQTLNQYEEKSLDGYKEGYLLQKGNSQVKQKKNEKTVLLFTCYSTFYIFCIDIFIFTSANDPICRIIIF